MATQALDSTDSSFLIEYVQQETAISSPIREKVVKQDDVISSPIREKVVKQEAALSSPIQQKTEVVRASSEAVTIYSGARTTANNNENINVVVKDRLVKRVKKNGGIFARLLWREAEKERIGKKSSLKNSSPANVPYFSPTAAKLLQSASDQGKKKKPAVEKKSKSKINISTLIVLKAIADGKYDNIVSPEQKFQIRQNAEQRNKLLQKYDQFGKLKKKHKWFYKIFKPEWYRLEKRCVMFLHENQLEINLLAVLICIDELRLNETEVLSPQIITFNGNRYVESTEECEKAGSRLFSSISGGSSSILDESESSESNSDADNQSYRSSKPPSLFSTDDEESEDEEIESKVSDDKKDKSGSSTTESESDEEVENKFNYNSADPQRTCKKRGIFSLNCKRRLSTGQYKNLLRQAAKDPDLCYGEYPKMFPEPGTILLFNVEQVQRKWDLKDLSMAQSEVRADGWSWLKSTGASKREGNLEDNMPVVVDHFRGRNKYDGNLESALPFDLWQYTTVDNKWQLLHYLGSSDNIAAGFPHKSSYKNIPISRSTRSNIQRLIRKSVDQKPTDVFANYWKDLDENVAKDPQLTLVTGPRNQKQVENARQKALNQARLSTNTIDNISTMGLRLRFPGYFLKKGSKSSSDSPRSFIDVLGLTDTNLYVYCENPLMFEELGSVIRDSGAVMKLYYDTKFLLGDFFLSVLSWEHPYFKKQVIIAAYIHDDKSHSKHEDFFRRIWSNNEQYLNGGVFVLITDGEFRLTNVWPRLTNLYCFGHLKENMKRALRGKGRIYRELCVQLMNELQKMETEKQFNKKLKTCLDLIDSKKAAKIFKYYGNKLSKRSSRWKILSCKLTDETVTTDRAESMNALIGRYKHKNQLFPDELLVILFFITQDQYGKIIKGYYRVPQGYDLTVDYIEKARGEPRQMTSLPFIPAITEIVPYIKNKSSLPLMPGMQRTGPLVKKQGDINSNTLNSMAQDLVLKQRVSQNPNNNKLFNVLDLGDNYHGVQLKDRDLSKQNYSCSCSAKDCVHLRAVFLFLNIPPEDIPFIASKDPLQILKRQRNKNKNETSAGKKKPRKGETTKDYRSDDDEHDDDVRSDDDVIRNDDIIKAFDSPDFSTKRKDNKMNKKSSSQSSKNIDERQFQMPAWQKDSKQKAVKEKEEDRSATNLEFDEIQANMNTIEKELRAEIKQKYKVYKDIYSPSALTVEVPAWWDETAAELDDVLFHKEIFKPNFFNPLPVIPEQKALIFVTADNHYAIVYRESGNKLSVYSMDHQLPHNDPEEMSFTAAHCARNVENDSAVVTIFSSVDDATGTHPLSLAASKLILLANSDEPEHYKLDLTQMQETNYAELLQVSNQKIESNAEMFLSSKRQRFYCCCRKSHFEATQTRNVHLQVPDMVQCKKCKEHFFCCCVNYSTAARSNKSWYCYTCTPTKLPELPSWGQGGENTCTLDNILAACVLMHKSSPDFINLIGDTSTFETELKTFLTHMGDTIGTISNAKRNFINAVYDEKNLFGTEEMAVFSKLLKVCGVANVFVCSTCGARSNREFQRKNFIGVHSMADSVQQTIFNVFHLINVVIPNTKCIKCDQEMAVEEIKYGQEYPWIIGIGLATEAVHRTFSYKEIEQLPLTVEYNGRNYKLGGITFNRKAHFVSILPVEGGWAYYDGLNTEHPVQSLPNALINLAKKSSVISSILYFLKPE